MEMVVTVVLVSFLMGYAWKIYFGGRETMRHTVSQSQMQTETRVFFDHLNLDISSAYRFIEVNPDDGKISFYRFQTSRNTLEAMLYDPNTGKTLPVTTYGIDVLKVEYSKQADGTVKRSQTPGILKIHKNMEFSEGSPSQYENTPNAPFEKTVLHNIADFDVKGYEQTFIASNDPNVNPVSIKEIDGKDPKKAPKITFIVLRIHNKIDEVKSRRDEELDLVGKFFSRVRLADAAYPGYFCSTDEDFEY